MPDPLPSSNTSQLTTEQAQQLRTQNAELRRLLEKHQWSGLTPMKSYGACPECSGSKAPFAQGHRPGCALAATLAAPLTRCAAALRASSRTTSQRSPQAPLEHKSASCMSLKNTPSAKQSAQLSISTDRYRLSVQGPFVKGCVGVD
jgi:hypothetical protein